ncbi:RNA-directed DNA polymerase from mobile element jockey [Trichonephila clavipes]|uniref:RNA-directed DNA polymerase from mobile element jockey n=1 Tax=Trichonephila clavipes TaxID=2585209 RepID=A0A8X6WA35_TRICX|nr:RNA-directed DNA polymerase from mobile element jockey [Trichonephila clavipes]
MSGVKKKLSGSQKRNIRKEKEYNINSKYAKVDNILISASSSSCASASSSNARELDEQGQAYPGNHKRRVCKEPDQKVRENYHKMDARTEKLRGSVPSGRAKSSANRTNLKRGLHIGELQLMLINHKQLFSGNGGVIDPPFQLTLFDDNIQWVSVVKYLGLHIDSRLTLKKHIDYLAEKFWGRIHLAISLVGRRSPLSLENKVILYKQILRPVITYGSPYGKPLPPPT